MDTGSHTQHLPEDAIFLPLPESRHGLPIRAPLSFDSFRENTQPEIIGEIEDKIGFSQPLGEQEVNRIGVYIKAPGTGFYVPPENAQFVPALKAIIDNYYSKYGDDGYCFMNVVQKIVDPLPDQPRPYWGAHKDVLGLDRGPASNMRVYIVSDTLLTGFADRPFTEAEIERLKISEDYGKAMHEILDRETYKPACKFYQITAFDSKSAHAMENPDSPTFRTVLIVNFVGPEWPYGKKLGNPFLEKAVAALEERSVPQAPISQQPRSRDERANEAFPPRPAARSSDRNYAANHG